MSCVQGRLAAVSVSDDGGTTWINLGRSFDISLSITVEEIECTSFDTVGSREYIPNYPDTTASFSFRRDQVDAGQEIVVDAIFAGSTFMLRLDPVDGLSASERFEAVAFATDYGQSITIDDTQNVSGTFRLSNLVRLAQP